MDTYRPETDAETLSAFLTTECPFKCRAALRRIQEGDERLLTAAEEYALRRAVVSVRRASGAARAVARDLCRSAGRPVTDILRNPDRTPLWPVGIVGSITHDAAYAAAAVTTAQTVLGLGLDIEPAEVLSDSVAALVASRRERSEFADLTCGEKALFSINEAVYKAVFPRDRIFLAFEDVTVFRDKAYALTRNGRYVNWRLLTSPRVLAIAWW